MIKAVVFDLGGVLLDNPAPIMIEYFEKHLGINGEDLVRISKTYISDFQKGLVSEGKIWQTVMEKLGVNIQIKKSIWKEAIREAYYPRKEMFSLVRDLKKNGLKVGILSNTEIPTVDFLREKDFSMFDAVIFSCLEQSRKPEKEIYLLLMKQLKLQAENIVFIDDREENVIAGQNLGIKGILFENSKQVKDDLGKILGNFY